VYLYVLEIKNPHPAKTIREIRLQSPGKVTLPCWFLGVTLVK
jgi:hypothetical protein